MNLDQLSKSGMKASAVGFVHSVFSLKRIMLWRGELSKITGYLKSDRLSRSFQ